MRLVILMVTLLMPLAAFGNGAEDEITWIAFNSVGNQVGTGLGAGGITITDVPFGTNPAAAR